MVKRSLFLWFLGVADLLSTLEACETPNGQQGQCIPIDQCPSLINKGDLKKSHCGFYGSQPKVCCPVNNLLPDTSICGAHSSEKIFGGEKADIDEFPWMALLKFQNADGSRSFECGGSLINKRYVLTAAHCILPSLVSVRLGEYNTETDPDCVTNAFGKDCAPQALDFGIEEMLVCDGYNPNDANHYHDIGLVRLDRDVQFSDFIKPVCLPSVQDAHISYVGKNLTVSGWGITETGTKSSIKLKVQVPVRELLECEKNYQKINIYLRMNSGQICAGGVKGRDSCRADSGGPLMNFKIGKNREPRFYAVGVVSYGPNPCGQELLPAIYTRVGKYMSWIVKSLKP